MMTQDRLGSSQPGSEAQIKLWKSVEKIRLRIGYHILLGNAGGCEQPHQRSSTGPLLQNGTNKRQCDAGKQNVQISSNPVSNVTSTMESGDAVCRHIKRR